MALAQHISIQNTEKVNHHFLWKISQTGTALLKRLLWHTKGYATVFGIMLLTFASLSFLYLYWSGKKLTQVFQHHTVVEQK
ncbi:hypothetical protein [Dendronalium sp. ChiSLP03b]|uniref:hypothetical protein n=1 Tax=Dendronalium sp. ChiSLP03b TaxID=3075381 RepID=UPI002AD31F81|nr:hypothetical protein [Dendronalium sp. ChiSLP03b]MDZ8207834.1 hypothetical protein [Dendronalium sp. ChiSLP03b]